MQLLVAGPSPFVRKVRVVLRETGQAEDVQEVSVTANPTGTAPELASANPLGKIPALLREDGPAIYDSRVICRYLDARAGAGLYPEARLWETLTLEATADGIMEAAVMMVYQARFGTAPQPWIDAQWDKVARAIEAIEQRWMSHLEGPLDAAQIAVGCALGYLDFRHPDRAWRPSALALAEWESRFAERGPMAETRPE